MHSATPISVISISVYCSNFCLKLINERAYFTSSYQSSHLKHALKNSTSTLECTCFGIGTIQSYIQAYFCSAGPNANLF